jgi:hypothetical protein
MERFARTPRHGKQGSRAAGRPILTEPNCPPGDHADLTRKRTSTERVYARVPIEHCWPVRVRAAALPRTSSSARARVFRAACLAGALSLPFSGSRAGLASRDAPDGDGIACDRRRRGVRARRCRDPGPGEGIAARAQEGQQQNRAAQPAKCPGSGNSPTRRDAARLRPASITFACARVLRRRSPSLSFRPPRSTAEEMHPAPGPRRLSAQRDSTAAPALSQNRSGTPPRPHSATGRSVAMGSSTIWSTCTVPNCARAPSVLTQKGTAETWRRSVVGRNFGVRASDLAEGCPISGGTRPASGVRSAAMS